MSEQPREDEILTVEIDRIGWSGHGLVRPEGHHVIHVPGTDLGEVVKVRLHPGPRRRTWGEVLEVIKPSPDRVDPICPHATHCPGCVYRHMSPARRATVSVNAHRGALQRMANLDLPMEVLPAPPLEGYRARAQARALPGAEGIVLGLQSHPWADEPIALGDCPAQTDGCRTLLAEAQRDLRAMGLNAFDMDTLTGEIQHVVVQPDDIGGGRVIVGITTDLSDDLLRDNVLVNRPKISLYSASVRPDRPRMVKPPRLIRGPKSLRLNICGDALDATHPAWTPQTPTSQATLREAVLSWLDPRPDDKIVEIGCGIGTLSLPLARRAHSLIGVDVVRAGVEDAKVNAARAGVENATFRSGRAAHALRRLLGGGTKADLVLLHAMRRPFGDDVLRLAATLGPRRLLYLAPSAPALARDLVAAPGLEVVRLGVLDQTPGTAHLLTLCLLAPRAT